MKKIYKNKRFLKNAALLLGSAAIFLSGILVFFLFSMKIPDFHAFGDRKVINSTQIYDRTGEVLLYDIHDDIKRTYISFDQMSASIKNATVAIEDAEFYEHRGVKPTAIIRAFFPPEIRP